MSLRNEAGGLASAQAQLSNAQGKNLPHGGQGCKVAGGEDPGLAPFLQVLDGHISAHPEQLQPITADLMARLDDLVG